MAKRKNPAKAEAQQAPPDDAVVEPDVEVQSGPAAMGTPTEQCNHEHWMDAPFAVNPPDPGSPFGAVCVPEGAPRCIRDLLSWTANSIASICNTLGKRPGDLMAFLAACQEMQRNSHPMMDHGKTMKVRAGNTGTVDETVLKEPPRQRVTETEEQE